MPSPRNTDFLRQHARLDRRVSNIETGVHPVKPDVAYEDIGDPADVISDWTALELINGWTGAAYWRRHAGTVELAGSVTGGVSGTAAFILPLDGRPANEVSFLTDLDQGGGLFNAARVLVSATTGHAIIYHPMTT